jgi:hypothetical protein
MPITDKLTVEEIAAGREIAESQLTSTKQSVDVIRVLHAQVVLQKAFPTHELAIFARYLDQDAPRLIQLLSADADTIELQEDAVVQALSDDQVDAIALANRAIQLIGTDDEILALLDGPDEEHEDWHEDWYEFQLDLRPEEEAVEGTPNGE